MYKLKPSKSDYFEEIANVYNSKNDLNISLSDESTGVINIDAQHYPEFSVIKSHVQVNGNTLHIPVQRNDPMLMMHFQMSGGMRFLAGGEYFVPELHHALNYFPEFRSKVVVDKEKPIQDLVIKLNSKFMMKFFSDYSSNLQEALWKLIDHQTKNKKPDIAKPITPQILVLINQFLSCPYKGEMGRVYKESIIKMLLINQLAQQKIDYNPDTYMVPLSKKLGVKDIDILQEIKSYLQENFLESLSIDIISRKFGLNTFKLKHGFKKIFGTSVMNFIFDLKMDYAVELIHNSDKTIVEIAEELGYQHYPSFSAAFKKKFGCAPSELKRKKRAILELN